MNDEGNKNLENGNIIIVKKKKKDDHGHHGGAWKVAYADFVTAMMALFIVLWILSQGDEVKKEVAAYFKSPIGISVGKGTSMIDKNAAPNSIKPQILAEFYAREQERARLGKMGEQLLEKLQEDKQLDEYLDQLDISIIDEGLRIEIMDSKKDLFFEISNSRLKKDAVKLLQVISKQLAKLPNKIVIEGHTDSRNFPGNGKGYSNYELSADRANAARRIMISSGLSDDQINEVRGYADNKLRNPEDPFDLVNRRISIIVKFSSVLYEKNSNN